jgi:predicted DNA-binding protein
MINKIALVQESFRLTPENSQKLEAIKQATGENKNSLINRMIEQYKAEGGK